MNLNIPHYYQRYLDKYPNQLINGLPLYGYEESNDGYNLETANAMFSFILPGISREYFVIRFYDDLALLIGRKEETSEDGALYQINIEDGDVLPAKLDISFNKYIDDANKWVDKLETAFERIEGYVEKKYDRKSKSSKISLKARNWKVVRSAVHDFIVALIAFRYNEQLNAMDVATFLVSDHPNYEPGHGIKAGLNMLFSSAYKSGSSFEIRFVCDAKGEKLENIPESIVEYANSIGVKINRKSTIINHEIGSKIYSHISGIDPSIEKIYFQTKEENNITIQGLCFLMNLRIWENHELKSILRNSSNPEGLLFGKVLPEDWDSFEAALQFGRNAITSTKFRNNIEILLEEFGGNSEIDSIEDYFTLSSSETVIIDSAVSNNIIKIEFGQEYIIFPRVRRFYLDQDIQEDLQHLGQIADHGKKVILIYSSEIEQKEKLIEQILLQTNLITVILPISVNELDEEIIKRMKRAKSLRT